MTDFDIEMPDESQSNKSAGFDTKQLLRSVLFNLHWIILSALCLLYAAKVFIRYQVPVYEISSSIYIGNGEFRQEANTVLKTAGLLDNYSNNINNQIFIFRSYNLIEQVVDSLKLNIQLTNNGRIKQQPINLDIFPYNISLKRNNEQLAAEYQLEIRADGYTLTDKKEKKYNGIWGQQIILPYADTLCLLKDFTSASNIQSLILHFEPKDVVINKYMSRLTVLSSKQATEMLELSLVDEYPDRAKHFLNTLLYFYDASAIQYKNQAIQKASQFLNNRIADVSQEIEELERSKKQSKITNQLNDVSETTSFTLQQLNSVDAQKGMLDFNKELITLVEEHIKSYDKRNEIVPNALTISDPVLASMVGSYNQLLLQRRGLKDIGTDKDPILKQIDGQLEELRQNILKNIQNIRTQYAASQDYYAKQENKYLSKFKSLPDVEKDMLQIERQLNIRQTLYEFLLQKKEEVGVQLASGDVNNSRLVDTPRNKGIVKPKAKSIYLTAISIGLLIPLIVIFLRQFLNKKITSKREVEAITDVPIVGEINEVKELPHGSIFINKTQSRSIVAEQYRALRTNLNYIGLSQDKKVILVTSFMRDEGKSFTSLNLADILSQAGKKIVCIEFDLRRPKISRKLGIVNKIGLSNYLSDTNIKTEALLEPVPEASSNLYVISSGPIPPNPSELLLNNRMEELFSYLRKEFDYIILDTAPVGLVSDTFSLAKYADITLYIVRHQFSLKPTLEFLNDLKVQKKLPNVVLLVNGIKSKKFDYGYGYGYGYSGTNGYGYSNDSDTRKNFFTKNK